MVDCIISGQALLVTNQTHSDEHIVSVSSIQNPQAAMTRGAGMLTGVNTNANVKGEKHEVTVKLETPAPEPAEPITVSSIRFLIISKTTPIAPHPISIP